MDVYGICGDGLFPAHFWCKKSPASGWMSWWTSWISTIFDPMSGAKTCALLHLPGPCPISTCGRKVETATCGGIDHVRNEVADGMFHSLQLLRYLTQEQDIQNSCSMLFQHPAVFPWKHLRVHGNFASPCEEKLRRSKPSKSALSIEPWAHVQKQKPPFQIMFKVEHQFSRTPQTKILILLHVSSAKSVRV